MGSRSDLIPLNMSRSSKVRKFSCRVLGFLIFISCQNKLVCAQRASKKRHKESTFWRYAGLVAGIHCRDEDLAFFPPRRIFSTINIYICSENAVHQSVDFTSCGLLLLKEECRISSFCLCLLVLANVR